MRGISVAAVNAKTPIKGWSGNETAADIGKKDEVCPWWKGVMSVDTSKKAGQAFFDSITEQYAVDWGVDFLKNDCVFGNQFVPDQARALMHTPYQLTSASSYFLVVRLALALLSRIIHPSGHLFVLFTSNLVWNTQQIHAQAASIRKYAPLSESKQPIVYSLSPGGGFRPDTKTLPTYAREVNADVNMYRVTGGKLTRVF